MRKIKYPTPHQSVYVKVTNISTGRDTYYGLSAGRRLRRPFKRAQDAINYSAAFGARIGDQSGYRN